MHRVPLQPCIGQAKLHHYSYTTKYLQLQNSLNQISDKDKALFTKIEEERLKSRQEILWLKQHNDLQKPQFVISVASKQLCIERKNY